MNISFVLAKKTTHARTTLYATKIPFNFHAKKNPTYVWQKRERKKKSFSLIVVHITNNGKVNQPYFL